MKLVMKILTKKVESLKVTHPLIGERMVIGMLRSQGTFVQRWKIRESIHRVDPLNAALRWLRSNPRWIYSVPCPNSLWHNDGLHKLVHWGMYIHACIDGYSRLVTSLICADNNRSDTALNGFLKGVEMYGIPSRVRVDYGSENNGIERFMQEQSESSTGYIRGPSVHNQRIERLHYDTTHCVLSNFIDIFISLEEQDIIDRNNIIDKLSLQFVFIPRIQDALDKFRNGWNEHPISTEKNRSPLQLFTMGMMNAENKEKGCVQRFENNVLAYFGVDPDTSLYSSEDEKSEETVIDECKINDLRPILFDKLNKESFDLITNVNYGINLFLEVRAKAIKIYNSL